MQDQGTDPLSPLAKKVIDEGSYDRLVATGETPAAARGLLDRVTPEQLFATSVCDRVAANAVLAALWLRHDALDACHQIVQKEPEALLVAGRDHAQRPGLTVLTPESAGSGSPRDPDFLRRSAGTLAFWHAIMHRREGDFSNAKYWYARCTDHPILPSLNAQASAILNPLPADKSVLRLTAHGWNPAAFVDFVEQVHEHPRDPRYAIAVTLQRLEWRVLFDHCTRAAVGG